MRWHWNLQIHVSHIYHLGHLKMAKRVAGYVHGVPASLCLLIHAVYRWLQLTDFFEHRPCDDLYGRVFQFVFSLLFHVDEFAECPDLADFHVVVEAGMIEVALSMKHLTMNTPRLSTEFPPPTPQLIQLRCFFFEFWY